MAVGGRRRRRIDAMAADDVACAVDAANAADAGPGWPRSDRDRTTNGCHARTVASRRTSVRPRSDRPDSVLFDWRTDQRSNVRLARDRPDRNRCLRGRGNRSHCSSRRTAGSRRPKRRRLDRRARTDIAPATSESRVCTTRSAHTAPATDTAAQHRSRPARCTRRSLRHSTACLCDRRCRRRA